ncbi:Putative ATP/GTP-binding protein [Streptomyces venezuelae]|nr:Putative ATP/GTP-binding protein [Streptomyces venezuelae]CUM44134.1 putative ATP/GTP-binding protein [Streptomyces venezuelae]
MALAFHQAVLDDRMALTATMSRLRELTRGGDYAYYIDIAFFMAGLPLPAEHTAPQWLDGEQATRARWRELVTARRDFLRARR